MASSEVLAYIRRTAGRQNGTALTDAQLLDDFIRRQDESAFAALVQRHAPMVWGVCRRTLSDTHDAEDAFQATFLVFVRKAGAIASRELLANWLYGVAHQTALKARATAIRRKVREKQVIHMPEPALAEPAGSDLEATLDQEISRLPDDYRVVVVLCDLQGMTRKQAAQMLGCPEGTVASRLARARALLAKRLAPYRPPGSTGTLTAFISANATPGVPASLVAATLKAAAHVAAGQAVALAVSPAVAALTEGVMKTMLMSKLKVALAVVLAAMLLIGGLGAGFVASASQPAEANQAAKDEPDETPAKPADLQRRVVELEKQVQALTKEVKVLQKQVKTLTAKTEDKMVKMFVLSHVVAVDVAKTLQRLMKTDEPNSTVSVSSEPITNRVLVSGTARDIEVAEALIAGLDKPAKKGAK